MVNVLSLFDGMSCGQIALNRLGIKINNYYASEIDKYAIEITQKNYPDTIQVGDVCKLKGVDFPKIDLLMGGSPCQGFSFAGKQLAFDDPRSALFFEFIRLLKEIKPKYFLLENVKMKKEYLQIIDQQIGVEGILIDSALVSAQSRKRYYWTNIPNIEQPTDLGLVMSDILEADAEEPMYSNIYGGFGEKKPREHYGKSVTIRANSGGGSIPSIKLKDLSNYYLSEKAIGYMSVGDERYTGKKTRAEHYIKKFDQKSKTLTASMYKGAPHRTIENSIGKWRTLTPLECERLQTVPDNFTEGVSNTQRYKMLGNGWTVDVIAHILGNAKW